MCEISISFLKRHQIIFSETNTHFQSHIVCLFIPQRPREHEREMCAGLDQDSVCKTAAEAQQPAICSITSGSWGSVRPHQQVTALMRLELMAAGILGGLN